MASLRWEREQGRTRVEEVTGSLLALSCDGTHDSRHGQELVGVTAKSWGVLLSGGVRWRCARGERAPELVVGWRVVRWYLADCLVTRRGCPAEESLEKWSCTKRGPPTPAQGQLEFELGPTFEAQGPKKIACGLDLSTLSSFSTRARWESQEQSQGQRQRRGQLQSLPLQSPQLSPPSPPPQPPPNLPSTLTYTALPTLTLSACTRSQPESACRAGRATPSETRRSSESRASSGL